MLCVDFSKQASLLRVTPIEIFTQLARAELFCFFTVQDICRVLFHSFALALFFVLGDLGVFIFVVKYRAFKLTLALIVLTLQLL